MGKFFDFSQMVRHDFKWWIRRNPLRWINDIYWAIRHRTIDRFDRIYISTLAPGYYDKDHQMIHACFQILTDFVEREKGIEGIEDLKKQIETESDPDCKGLMERQYKDDIEIEELYNWWKNVYLKRKDPEYTGPEKDYKSPEFEKWSKVYTDWELACSKEDEAQLIRLMKVREALWT
jgi:hypothetical protein